MPLCGFNKSMLKGLRQFHLGLVEHGLIDHSIKRKATIKETIEKEFQDMERFQKELHGIKDLLVRTLIKNLINYTNSFYRLINDHSVKDYQKTITTLERFYFEIDRKYYEELEGKPDDM